MKDKQEIWKLFWNGGITAFVFTFLTLQERCAEVEERCTEDCSQNL